LKKEKQELSSKPSINLNASERRKSLFDNLDHCISLSREKMCSRGNSDRAKQSWGRLLVSAISVYGGLIKDYELLEIEDRLSKLEAQTT
jgi:hypothetical protein